MLKIKSATSILLTVAVIVVSTMLSSCSTAEKDVIKDVSCPTYANISSKNEIRNSSETGRIDNSASDASSSVASSRSSASSHVKSTSSAQSIAESSTAAKPAPILLDDSLSFICGSTATVTLNRKPNTEYSITVYYASGKSSASGLENKVSDENGAVSWTWRISGRTTPGNYKIIFSGGDETLQMNFTLSPKTE